MIVMNGVEMKEDGDPETKGDGETKDMDVVIMEIDTKLWDKCVEIWAFLSKNLVRFK